MGNFSTKKQYIFFKLIQMKLDGHLDANHFYIENGNSVVYLPRKVTPNPKRCQFFGKKIRRIGTIMQNV